MGRPATSHESVRQRLVAIGRELIAEQGVDRLMLADVAERAGLSTPSLYHYFRNRRELVLDVLRAEVRELLDVVQIDAGPEGDHAARLSAFMAAQLAYFSRTSPATVAFVLQSLLQARDDAEIGTVVAPVFGKAEALFRDASAALPPRGPRGATTRGRERQRREPARTDLLRACLAGLFLMRAVEADADAAAVFAELRHLLDAG